MFSFYCLLFSNNPLTPSGRRLVFYSPGWNSIASWIKKQGRLMGKMAKERKKQITFDRVDLFLKLSAFDDGIWCAVHVDKLVVFLTSYVYFYRQSKRERNLKAFVVNELEGKRMFCLDKQHCKRFWWMAKARQTHLWIFHWISVFSCAPLFAFLFFCVQEGMKNNKKVCRWEEKWGLAPIPICPWAYSTSTSGSSNHFFTVPSFYSSKLNTKPHYLDVFVVLSANKVSCEERRIFCCCWVLGWRKLR